MTATATTPTPETALAQARPKYNPLAPVGTANGLKELLDASKRGIAQALPRHITPERLIKTLLVAANRTPDLLLCTQASVLETINRAAELGLDLSGTLGEAYPVPFNNSVKDANNNWHKIKQCQLIIGYRGLAKLARQTGEIKRIEAEVVCVNDRFVYRKGLNGTLEFEPLLTGDRGEIVGAYALVEFKDGGVQYDFMPRMEIERVRATAMSKDSPAWKNHWEEMAKKTVFRRVAKWLPLSTEKFVAALEHDNATDGRIDLGTVVSAETRPAGAAALADRLKPAADEPLMIEGEVVSEDDAPAADTADAGDPETAPETKLNAAGEKAWNELTAACNAATGLEGQHCAGCVDDFIASVDAQLHRGSLNVKPTREAIMARVPDRTGWMKLAG